MKLLELCQNPRQALDMAMRMERFVIHGQIADDVNLEFDEGLTGPDQVQRSGGEIGETLTPPPKKQSKRRWTPEEEESLAAFCRDGLALEEIAEKLDRPPLGVRERARVLNLRIKSGLTRVKKKRAGSHDDGTGLRQRKAASLGGFDRRQGFYSRRGRRSRLKGESLTDEQKAQKIQSFLSNNGATRNGDSIDTVVTFMRSRDYSVVRSENGRFLVDEREDLTSAQLIERANRVRVNIGREPFPVEFLESARAV